MENIDRKTNYTDMTEDKKHIQVISNNYLGSYPDFEYTISINNIDIKLTKDDFKTLVSELSSEVSKDLNKAMELSENGEYKRKKHYELMKEARKVFYFVDEEDGGTCFQRKEVGEIDVNALDEVIEKLDGWFNFR